MAGSKKVRYKKIQIHANARPERVVQFCLVVKLHEKNKINSTSFFC